MIWLKYYFKPCTNVEKSFGVSNKTILFLSLPLKTLTIRFLMIYLTENAIDINYLLDFVQDGGAGAIDVFIGTVRNQTSEKKVVRLEYEAYDTMAIKKIQEIVNQATKQWNILKYAIAHRKGILQIGEVAVVIAVATPHRQAAFEACKYIIDTIKENVPIWKKEVYEDGEIWVAAHP